MIRVLTLTTFRKLGPGLKFRELLDVLDDYFAIDAVVLFGLMHSYKVRGGDFHKMTSLMIPIFPGVFVRSWHHVQFRQKKS